MPKKPAPKNNRKPPEPADGHAVIQEWMEGVMPGVRPIVEQVDKLIRKSHSGLQYAVKWSRAYYGLPEQGWIIEVVPYHVSVNVVFHAGAKFDPPPPLGEGSRYVKLASVEEADTPELRDWIRQAGKAPGLKA